PDVESIERARAEGRADRDVGSAAPARDCAPDARCAVACIGEMPLAAERRSRARSPPGDRCANAPGAGGARLTPGSGEMQSITPSLARSSPWTERRVAWT